ncbi:MAG: ribonuclease R [Candidatus Tectomicrobia bacterium]|uniref:Ribonuclease R n=1 Tax=Tectimicrobiota bacterium TaxID=2528274 RepID=A0A932GND6_UNCTE|nr:ribonuclease R [Candidatus Tectomicrobia bacterium]
MIEKDEILRRLESLSRPLTLKELIHHFRVPSEKRPAFRRLVREIGREGHLIRVGGNRYSLPGPLKLATGKIQIHPEGYGFLTPEGKKGSDIHIPERFTGGAMDGDKVQAQVEGSGRYRKNTGRVVRILERAHTSVVGVLEPRGKSFVLIPQNRRLGEVQILKKDSAGARRGLAAVAEILDYPEQGNLAQGRVTEVLGDPEGPDVGVEIVLRKYGIPGPFPERVLKEVASCPQKVLPEDFAGRLDLRDLVTFTIDGETARDFDDAVSIEKTPGGGYRLGVHIADVGHYVREGSLVDREAQNRGNSVYFPDRAIHMLPEPLAAGICSLKPDEDRLTQSVFLDLDSRGNVLGARFADAVIRSRQRFTYTVVAKLLARGDPRLEKQYEPLLPSVRTMGELAKILREHRLARGSLDFDLPEADIILDSDGQVESILRQERNDAHKLIEEFMLAANQAVASFILRHGHPPGGYPGLYRVHEPPDPLKMADLAAFLETLGYSLPDAESVRPGDLRDVLERAQGKPEERLLNMLVLRSLRQARYAAENLGHFALHFDDYTHFTSPIRRYPDLVVHRILRRMRRGKGERPAGREAALANLGAVAEHSSWTERRADEAERDLVDLKKIQFMGKHLGEEFAGHISGVTRFGFFVELEDYFVEGLVPLTLLKNDYYVFDEVRHTLRGERTRKAFRLGDRVRIRVENTSIELRRIDFSLSEPARTVQRRRRR